LAAANWYACWTTVGADLTSSGMPSMETIPKSFWLEDAEPLQLVKKVNKRGRTTNKEKTFVWVDNFTPYASA
jgi:hypothetical protein